VERILCCCGTTLAVFGLRLEEEIAVSVIQNAVFTAATLRFTPEPKRRHALVSTSVRSADISLPQLRVLAAKALLLVAAVQAARPPLPVWAAAMSVASRLASSPASVAKVVERAAVRVSTRGPQACPGTQVATGPVTKPSALNCRVR
jgi:hypothetical protein